MEIKDVIGAILSDLASARNISDLHSRRLVNYYRQDSLLKYFPVPRAEIKSVNIEMKFAVKMIEEDGTRTSTKKGKISNVIEKYTFELVNQVSDTVLHLYARNAPLEYMAGALNNAEDRQYLIQQIVENSLRKLDYEQLGSKTSQDRFSSIITETFRSRWPEELNMKLKYGDDPAAEYSLETFITEMLKNPVDKIMEEVQKIKKTPNDLRVELIFESDKLQELPASAISTVSIVSEIKNYNWQKVGDKENKPEHRLQPE
jgi:hypothetical protein